MIACIVLTGGGSELKHIKQLVEYITGIDTRIGYPNEHISGESAKLVSRPLYATAVGLMMKATLTIHAADCTFKSMQDLLKLNPKLNL